MTQTYCLCLHRNTQWWLKDFQNDRHCANLTWTANQGEAYRFGHHEEAIAVAQIVKRYHPTERIRLMEFQRGAST